MDTQETEAVISILTKHYPVLQAIYIFGFAVEEDIALLFPYDMPIKANSLFFSDAKAELERYFSRPVDIVQLRLVSTVLKKEIIFTGSRIYTKDALSVDTYEMITLSLYQKLKDDRKEILEEIFRSGRAADV